MLLIAAVEILLTDVMVAIVGFLVFPAIAGLNVVYQRRLARSRHGHSSCAPR